MALHHGIGTVDVDGSTTVSPIETTTYTITATGPGGTTTASVTLTVTHPLPTVTISADPETINFGDSTTLTWSSTYADSATIDNDIGDVPVEGSTTVSPSETTTYTIIASNPVETATASITVTIIPLNISITSPLDGDTISRPDIMVKGTIANLNGSEVGITVNGIVAMVEGDQFVANHVPLEEGENVLNVIAMDWEGNMASASITVYAETEGEYIRITADDESGTSPLETTLRIEGSFTFTDPYLTCTGPGVVEFLGMPEENEYEIQITGEGVYYFTAEVTDTESNLYADTIAIVVLDQAELDALLKAKWEGMRQALAQNDIDSAVRYFSESSKENYKEMFTILSESLSHIEQELGDIQFIAVMKNSAEYDIRITRDGVEYSFYLLFAKDEDGLWKIKSF